MTATAVLQQGRALQRAGARVAAVAALFAAAVLLERAGAVSLLAWTDRLFPASRYPWLFALLFVAYLGGELAGEAGRKRILLAASVAAVCVYDLRFAAISAAFFLAYYRLVFSRAHRYLKLAFLVATFAAWALACNLVLFPDLLTANPWLLGFGAMFALNYTFRLFYFHHEMALRRFARVPLDDFLLYFVFAPFFVIVPYMLAIPRYERFTRGIARRDPEVVASAVRWLAAGLAVSLACSAALRVYAPEARFVDALRRGDLAQALPAGLLLYPLWAVLSSLGPAFLLVGLLRLFGVPIGPAFDRPLVSAGILDWWRRWNVHFRDFLVDLFFYPVALRLRKRPRLAIILGCASVFLVGSTLFHWPKHYFTRNSHLDPNLHLLVENAIFCALVAAALWREKRRGAPPPPPRGLARAGLVARTWVLVFAVVVVAGYGAGWAYRDRPAERATARFAEARAADPARAAELAGPLVHDLRRLARLTPREPLRRLQLAWALRLPSPARDLAEAAAHLRVAAAFLDDRDPAQRALYAELTASPEEP